jgi:hypothetical protein
MKNFGIEETHDGIAMDMMSVVGINCLDGDDGFLGNVGQGLLGWKTMSG